MTTYARKENGHIIEVFPAAFYDIDVFAPPEEEGEELKLLHKAGDEIPIESRFHPDFVAHLEVVPDGTMIDPVPDLQQTPAEQAAAALATRDALLTLAGIRIAPLQDAVDLDEATADKVARLKKWKQFRVAVNRAALEPYPITWPVQPE